MKERNRTKNSNKRSKKRNGRAKVSLTEGIRGLAELTYLFDRQLIDGITNGVGITSFFVGKGIKYLTGSRISFYLLLYLFSVLLFLIFLFFFSLNK